MIKNITIGADPEVFLINEDGYSSAEGKFGGTKDEPRKLDREGFSIQEDNVMVEFNIPPSDNLTDFMDNIRYMVDYIKVGANQFDCLLDDKCSAEFPERELNTEQAQMFGCEPDYNAYTEMENPAACSTNPLLRTAGGHIHIGYDNPNDEDSIKLIKALDITLGLPSLIRDPDKRRREMYGKAGAYRLKDFGVEYRTLSNFWIFSKDHLAWVYDGVHAAVDMVNSGAMEVLEGSPFFDAVENVINKNNTVLARNLIMNLSRTLKSASVCVD